MSNLILSVFSDYNNPDYINYFADVYLDKIDVHRKSSHISAVISSSRLLPYNAVEDFAAFIADKFPEYSLSIINKFDFGTFSTKHLKTLIQHFCDNVSNIPLNFFDKSEVSFDSNVMNITVSKGYSFLRGCDFENSFSEYIASLTSASVPVRLIKIECTEEEQPSVILPPIVKMVEKKPQHTDFNIEGLDIKDSSVKVFMGKYTAPKNLMSIEDALIQNGKVMVWGKVFAVAQQGNFRKIYIYSITDGTNSINIKILLEPNEKNFDKYDSIKPGTYFLVRGDCQLDKYERDYVIMPYDIVTFDVKAKKRYSRGKTCRASSAYKTVIYGCSYCA